MRKNFDCPVNTCITQSSIQVPSNSAVPAQQLFAVSEQKRSGLILCKRYYAEFVGPGAAICGASEKDCDRIIIIGSPEVIEVTTHEARQQAYGRRIQWIRWLHRIVSAAEPQQRAEKLFSGFEEFFGSEVLVSIPDDVLALLAGVLPHTITILRSHQQNIERGDAQHYPLVPNGLDVKVIPLDGKPFYSEICRSLPPSTPFLKALSFLPCSA